MSTRILIKIFYDLYLRTQLNIFTRIQVNTLHYVPYTHTNRHMPYDAHINTRSYTHVQTLTSKNFRNFEVNAASMHVHLHFRFSDILKW